MPDTERLAGTIAAAAEREEMHLRRLGKGNPRRSRARVFGGGWDRAADRRPSVPNHASRRPCQYSVGTVRRTSVKRCSAAAHCSITTRSPSSRNSPAVTAASGVSFAVLSLRAVS